jgi:hypothetical protein
MANKKHNKKLPKCAVNEGEVKPKYGYVYGEADPCGGGHLSYRNPKEHEKTWEQTVKPSGNYKTVQHDKDKEGVELVTQLNPGHVRNYVGKGDSKQVDGNHEVTGELAGSHQYGGDDQYNRKGDHYHGTGGKVLKGSGGGVFEIHTGKGGGSGDSGSSGGGGGGDTDSGKTKYNKAVNGDTVEKNKGNHHSNREGDEVKSITGTKIQMIKEGDYATNVQGGNWDTDISKKARMNSGSAMLFSSGDTWDATSSKSMGLQSGSSLSTKSKQGTSMQSGEEFKINSDEKITIKVGGSSITIEDGTITIKASKIKFEEG